MPAKFTQHVTQATLQNRFERRSVVIADDKASSA